MGHSEYVCCRSKRRTHPHSRTGLSPLVARPAPPLSMASFAVKIIVVHCCVGKAFCSRKTAPTLESHTIRENISKKEDTQCIFLFAGDPYGTRTHDTTVRGWCLNRLTNGPYVFCFCPVPYGGFRLRSKEIKDFPNP